MKEVHEQEQAKRRKPLREMEACEDPICCCEAEPRWLRFEELNENPGQVGEWEVLERTTREEF